MAFRTFLKDLTLPFSKNWLHDEWIAALASIVGIKGVPIPESLVLYRQHRDQQQGEYKNLRENIENSLTISPDIFAKRASAYREMKERVLERQTGLDHDQRRRIELLERKSSHFLQRKFIRSSSGRSKFRTILSEYRLKNYQSFSYGWLSIGCDIIFRKSNVVKPDSAKV